MTKTKISELEKMYNVNRKEIIAFLNEKGIEAKTANSSVDEAGAKLVASKFAKGGSAPAAEAQKADHAPKAEIAPKTEKAPKEETKAEQSAPKTENAAKAEQSAPKTENAAKADAEAPKKKKIIIVTGGNNNNNNRNASYGGQGNNQGGYNNNRQGGNGQGGYNNRQGGNQGNRNSRPNNGRQDNNRQGGGNRFAAQNVYRPIKPTTVPSQMEVDYHKPEPQPARQPKPQTTPVAPVEETKIVTPVAETPVTQTPVAETPATPTTDKVASTTTPTTPAANATTEHAPAANREHQDRQGSYNNNRQGGYNNNRQGGYQGNNQDRQGGYNNNRQGGYNNNRQGGYQGNNSQGGYQGNRQGGYQGNNSQGGYNNNRQGGYQGNRQGGYQGNGGQGGYQGNRQGGYQGNGGQGGYQGNRQGGGYGQSRPGQGGGYQGNRQGGYQGGGQGGNRPYGQGRPGQGGGYGNRQGGYGQGQNRSYGQGRPGQGGGDTFVKDAEKHRDENKRKMNQERDKRSRKDLIYTEEELKNRPGRFIRPEKKVEEVVEEQIKVIALPEKISVRELAEKMHMQPAEIIKKMFLKGEVLTVNSELTYEEAENIAIDYDIICEKEVKVDVIEELLKEEDENEEGQVQRPPVICVMGHVDHGKTSLLDAIRKTNVTDKEAGGITQHIGAYTVTVQGRSITFLDTPGHEAFTAMRMRGANSTDIAVLVVAADDGVMPQTIEAINHAKAAGIEIIVAVNKIDKPNANLERVKQEMTEYELVPTDWGGTTEFVPVSAKSGQGIDTLLETILLTSEILELKANPNRTARGLVLEAKLDKGRGPVANVLIQKGTLHVGDFISAGPSHGKVRAMVDDKGRRVKEAGPSIPVEILGLSDVPSAGEVILAHEDDKTARSFAETYMTQHKENLIEDTKMRMSLDDLFNQMKEGNLKEFDIIIKADVQGSVEALKQSLLKLSNEEVVVKCIHGGVGAINESDVTLASASNAIIIGFNVRPDATAKAMAEREGVDMRLYKVIYQAIDDVEAALKGMLAPVYEEKILGHAEVRQIFKASAIGNIAGSVVTDGMFKRGCQIRIRRDGEQIYEGNLKSLKRFKDDVKEVKEGFECGLVFEDFDKMQELDVVEAYEMVEVPRS